MNARGWVFDLDGTLTVAVHDFGAMKMQLGLDPSRPLMEGLQALPEEARREAWRVVEQWEIDLAEQSRCAVGAEALLSDLTARGVRLGVLTRNTREVALRSLEVTGLMRWFSTEHILGRHCCAPKPSPAGVERLATAWGMSPSETVMVGDSEIDVLSGRAAGARSIRVAVGGESVADLHVATLEAIRPTC